MATFLHPHQKLTLFASLLLLGGAVNVHAANDAPKIGGTLVYLEQQPHTNLYTPAGGFYPNGGILNQITDKLTYQNPETLEIEPWVAESWSINADNTEYTFKIRPGVSFSDGTPLDANAVAKNVDTYGLGNTALNQPVSEVINNYLRSEVIDPLTVKFYFKKPSPGFLQGTSAIGSGLVSLSTLERNFNQLGNAKNIIGSGPFVVSSEKLGRELKLTARKDYDWAPVKSKHQGRAYLDGITYLVTPEDSVRIGALVSGQADFIRQIQAYDEKRVQSQGFNLYAPPTRGVNNSVVFRPDNPLVADIRVRKALLHATNTKEIIDTLLSDNYPQATSPLAKTAAGYVDLSSKLTFDPVQANKLLDEAGWKTGPQGLRQKDGKTLELTAYESLPQPQNKETLQLVSQQWAKVGVKLNVLAGDAGSKTVDSLDPLKTGVAPAMVGRADPDVLKSQYYPTVRNVLLQKGGSSDKVKDFVDPHLNTLLDGIAAETDRSKRLTLVGEVQGYLIDQAYVIPIFEEPQVFAGAPTTKGIAFEAVGRPSFYNTWLDK
ncbi:ABC-type transporter, substrate binding protein [Pectobacterium atrosepticum SCRI1043]|uniref:ABC-type transporter, substrate binding protein n=1 Tax=Pectobacterium atrosepticum (strain SCRI 1043 / ATCC BAA-672) TaxID=218491 RepID=Q6DB26_PECAS|nr:TIGR04028 family ABC transporter substrate-binding protein [Pectobacterium atrosepticum]GKV87379.1 ABC transporter substrate-binding protein [Pectobacterium carotovorum subsp. carotovorum]AIA69092.1 ABC transporter substrate-binding protein [Pectobacterium atrosepticum]AIK11997.1 ABC-type transporter, substrate binding protein [Pectobacterium atrosepticum]KFX13545.1 ABC transporter substrate-binding protein [Pectobacterium atrosepticum]KMK83426.1 ABC transporter substrate binding protein [P